MSETAVAPNHFSVDLESSREIDGVHMRVLTLFAALACAGLMSASAQAGPSPEVARRCVQYSYLVYPYKRPGSVRGSRDRQVYFKDCMAREGNVPEPVAAKS